jgi:hypothetical protein
MTRAASTSKALRWVEETIEPGLLAMMKSARRGTTPPPCGFEVAVMMIAIKANHDSTGLK